MEDDGCVINDFDKLNDEYSELDIKFIWDKTLIMLIKIKSINNKVNNNSIIMLYYW